MCMLNSKWSRKMKIIGGGGGNPNEHDNVLARKLNLNKTMITTQSSAFSHFFPQIPWHSYFCLGTEVPRRSAGFVRCMGYVISSTRAEQIKTRPKLHVTIELAS